MKTLMKYSLLLASCVALSAQASVNVLMHSTTQSGVGEGIGHVTLQDTPYGLLIVPDLQGLPPGVHGFHIHENANCGNAGKDAGGHLDPAKTDQHLGPYNDKGHLGDLPVLVVDDQGSATLPVLAPRLHLKDVEGRSLMIHDGSDNYSDVPNPMGGGGARIACGIIP